MTISNPSAAPQIYDGSNTAVQTSGDAAWEDVDLSAIVPVGTKYAHILALVIGAGPQNLGVRGNGSTITLAFETTLNRTVSFVLRVDDNRIIECNSQLAIRVNYYALAWWV